MYAIILITLFHDGFYQTNTLKDNEERVVVVDTIMINSVSEWESRWDCENDCETKEFVTRWYISYWDDLVITLPKCGTIRVPMFFRRHDSWLGMFQLPVQCTEGWCSTSRHSKFSWIGRKVIYYSSNYDVSVHRINTGQSVVSHLKGVPFQ